MSHELRAKSSRNASRPKRGVAMLLVLISLMLATILSMAYVASRDNSAAIGENIASSAAARWASESGLDTGLAILQTEADWRTMHDNGKLLDDFPLNGGTLDLDVVDLETNLPPTSTSSNIQLRANATVNGMEQETTAVVYVPFESDKTVDVDLSEFAVFGSDQISLSGDSIVTRWRTAPLADLGRRLLMATKSTTAGAISVNNNAAPLDTTVFAAPGSSGSLVNVGNTSVVATKSFPDPIPMPLAPSSGFTMPLISLAPTLNVASGTATISTNQRYSSAQLSGATRRLTGTIDVVSDSDLTLQSNAKLRVDGNVRLVVLDDLTINNASIELGPTGKLTLYVGDQMNIVDGYIGDARVDSTRDASGRATWVDPERIKIFRLPQYTGSTNWKLDNNSVVKGSMYAPGATLSIVKQSASYGRVAAGRVVIADQGAVFYDPGLDQKLGFTTFTSSLYDSSSRLKEEFKTLNSLDPSVLQSLADATGATVKNVLNGLLNIQPTNPPADDPDIVPPTEPTPRPIEIEYQLVSFGTDLHSWEKDVH